MWIDRSEVGVTTIHDRPLFAPLFCLLFVVLGLGGFIEHSPSSNGDTMSVAAGVSSLLLGAVGFLCSARRSSYRFDSSSARMSWVRRSCLGVRRGEIPFGDIDRVYIHGGPDPEDTTYRVILFTTDGVFALNHGFTCEVARLRQVEEAIEDALTRPRRAG